MWQRILGWIVPLILVLAVQGWAQQGLKTSVVAPSIAGLTLDGRPFEGLATVQKPLLIYVWGSWCGICRSMQGTLNQIGKEASVVSVALSSGGPETVRGYMEAQGFELSTVVDDDGTVAEAYGVHGVPALFFVDRQGVIQQVTTGFTSALGIRLRLWWAGRS